MLNKNFKFPEIVEKLNKCQVENIKLIILDVDGTLTDGGIYLDSNGIETKKFNIKDGAGIVLARKYGIKFMILTGRKSKCVEIRAKELGIEYIEQGISKKEIFLQRFINEHQLVSSEIAYIGDDYNDIECMKLVGCKICPNDATEEVKEIADCIMPHSGGKGAVRDFCDFIIYKKCSQNQNQ